MLCLLLGIRLLRGPLMGIGLEHATVERIEASASGRTMVPTDITSGTRSVLVVSLADKTG